MGYAEAPNWQSPPKQSGSYGTFLQIEDLNKRRELGRFERTKPFWLGILAGVGWIDNVFVIYNSMHYGRACNSLQTRLASGHDLVKQPRASKVAWKEVEWTK